MNTLNFFCEELEGVDLDYFVNNLQEFHQWFSFIDGFWVGSSMLIQLGGAEMEAAGLTDVAKDLPGVRVLCKTLMICGCFDEVVSHLLNMDAYRRLSIFESGRHVLQEQRRDR